MSRPPLFRALAVTACTTGALLATLASPALAVTGVPDPATCTTLSGLSLTPGVATGTLDLSGTVSNCSGSYDVLTLVMRFQRIAVAGEVLDPSCVTSETESAQVGLRRWGSRSATVSYPAPTCPGSWELQVSATTSAGVVTTADPIPFAVPLPSPV